MIDLELLHLDRYGINIICCNRPPLEEGSPPPDLCY